MHTDTNITDPETNRPVPFASKPAMLKAAGAPTVAWYAVSPSSEKGLTMADVRAAIENPPDAFAHANATAPMVAFDRKDPKTWIGDDASPNIAAEVDASASKAFEANAQAKQRVDHTVLAFLRVYMHGVGLGMQRLDDTTLGTKEYKASRMTDQEGPEFVAGLAGVMPRIFGPKALTHAKRTGNQYRSNAKTIASRAVIPFDTMVRCPVVTTASKKEGDAHGERTLRHAWVRLTNMSIFQRGATIRPAENGVTLGTIKVDVVTFEGEHAGCDWTTIKVPALKEIIDGNEEHERAKLEAYRQRQQGGAATAADDAGEAEIMGGQDAERGTHLREIATLYRSILKLRGEAREEAIKELERATRDYVDTLQEIIGDALAGADLDDTGTDG